MRSGGWAQGWQVVACGWVPTVGRVVCGLIDNAPLACTLAPPPTHHTHTRAHTRVVARGLGARGGEQRPAAAQLKHQEHVIIILKHLD